MRYSSRPLDDDLRKMLNRNEGLRKVFDSIPQLAASLASSAAEVRRLEAEQADLKARIARLENGTQVEKRWQLR